MVEEWRVVPGYSRYMVSNTGKIKSLNYNRGKTEKEMCLPDDGRGYVRICLRNDKGENDKNGYIG